MLNEVGAGCSEVQEEIDPALQGFSLLEEADIPA